MFPKFAYYQYTPTLTTGYQYIGASPTLASEEGSYTYVIQKCITSSGLCASCSFPVTVAPCVPSSMKILQSSPSGILSAKSWTISTTAAFAYQLTVDATTTCGYTPTAWTVAATSTNNAGSITSF